MDRPSKQAGVQCKTRWPLLERLLFRRSVAWLLVVGLICASQVGCVHRRMFLRTNPPGAVVYVDDYEIGTTPVATDFTYYGTRKIRLVKDGYETLTVMQKIRPPWYQIPPLDFVAENLLPGEIRDARTLDFQLIPQMIVPNEQLLGRAEGLRDRAHAAAVVSSETVSDVERTVSPDPRTMGPPPPTEPRFVAPRSPPPGEPSYPPDVPSYPPSGPSYVPPGTPNYSPSVPNYISPDAPYIPPATEPPAGGYPVHPLPR